MYYVTERECGWTLFGTIASPARAVIRRGGFASMVIRHGPGGPGQPRAAATHAAQQGRPSPGLFWPKPGCWSSGSPAPLRNHPSTAPPCSCWGGERSTQHGLDRERRRARRSRRPGCYLNTGQARQTALNATAVCSIHPSPRPRVSAHDVIAESLGLDAPSLPRGLGTAVGQSPPRPTLAPRPITRLLVGLHQTPPKIERRRRKRLP